MSANEFFRKAQFPADPPHLILEEFPKRLDEFEGQIVREAADVVMGLDRLRRSTRRKGLDHVRIERSLNEVTRPGALLPGDPAEHIDEHVTDAPALFFGLLDPVERREKLVRRIDDHESDSHVLSGCTLDVCTLVFSKKPVVHEDARQSVSDRPVHQGSGDGRVDPTGESTDRGPLTYRGLNPFHRLLYEGARRPGRATLTNPEEKIRDDLLTAGCMCHLWMELYSEDGTLRMPECSYG